MDSIWLDSAELPRFPELKQDVKTDVLIIGGGMTGVLCAWMLKNAGVDCVLLEAARIGGGITKNTTAKITAQHGLIYHQLLRRFGPEKARMYLDANLDAVEEFRRLCAGIDCDHSQQDNFVFSRTDRKKLDEELAALDALGYGAEFACGLPLPFFTVGAVKFPKQGQFHPLKFLAAVSKGLPIYENTPVRELGKGTAVTDHGTVQAEAIIVATHFPFLNKHGSYFLKLYQQRSYVLALENVPKLKGMYLEDVENGLSFRGYGDTLLLGGGGHRTGKSGGNWKELENFAAARYPEAKILRRWATQDCMSLDGVPYIGQYSARTPGLYVATGYNKWGMTSAMAAARILTDKITGRENLYAPVFSPSRTILRPQLAVNGWEAVSNLLTPSQKRCPHLGCALKWNPQEHSWDCPCHGSRFDETGRRLNHPATGDLPIKKQGAE